MSGCTISYANNNPDNLNNITPINYYDGIVITRIDYSVYIEEKLIGNFFYEKPHIWGNSEAINKINNYFINDYENFFHGTSMFFGENGFQRMTYELERSLEWQEFESLAAHPFQYNVITKMTYLSEDYISFLQIHTWAHTGPRGEWFNGVTFNLTTGELVSFTEFYYVDPNVFRTSLVEFLLQAIDENWLFQDEIINTYGPNDDNSFLLVYFGIEAGALDKQFFYDGCSINLTLNHGLYPHMGLIVRWNGATGEKSLWEG